MGMSNSNVVYCFVRDHYPSSGEARGSNLRARRDKGLLVSYFTIIAVKLSPADCRSGNRVFLVSERKMSPSTSRHLSYLRYSLFREGAIAVNVPFQWGDSYWSFEMLEDRFAKEVKDAISSGKWSRQEVRSEAKGLYYNLKIYIEQVRTSPLLVRLFTQLSPLMERIQQIEDSKHRKNKET